MWIEGGAIPQQKQMKEKQIPDICERDPKSFARDSWSTSCAPIGPSWDEKEDINPFPTLLRSDWLSLDRLMSS